MDQHERLVQYITEKRAQGIGDGEIRGKLLEVGVPENRIDGLFADAAQALQRPPVVSTPVSDLQAQTAPEADLGELKTGAKDKPQPAFDVHRSLNRFHFHVHANRKLWVALVLIVVLVVAGGVWWNKNQQEVEVAQASAQSNIDDPNYSINLPIGWHATSDYKPGSGLNVFYPKNQNKGSLVIYVLPFTKSSESSAAHAANKINELSKNGTEASVLNTQSVQFGTTQGSMTTVLGASARNPATEKSCYIFANVDYNNVAYNVDLTTLSDNCHGAQLTSIQKALASFKPKATDLQYQQH